MIRTETAWQTAMVSAVLVWGGEREDEEDGGRERRNLVQGLREEKVGRASYMNAAATNLALLLWILVISCR